MRRLDHAHRLLAALGEAKPGAPDHVLAERPLPPEFAARRLVRVHDIVQDLFPVQRHHRLEAMARHHLDRPPARDGHENLDREMLRPRHDGDLAQAVAAILDRRRAFEEFTLEMKRFLVEAFEQELEPLLEPGAVPFGIDQRPAEGLDLARVVAAPHAHDDAPVGDDIRHRVVLGEADRVPHRQHVEGAAELEPLRLGREPEPELHQIGQALIALALEMMLGGPERVEPAFLHDLRNVARRPEGLREPLARITPRVGRRSVKPDIVERDLPDIEHVESLDHGAFLPSTAHRRAEPTHAAPAASRPRAVTARRAPAYHRGPSRPRRLA